MDREEIIKKLGNYVTLQPIDYSKLTDEELAFRLKLFESMFSKYFEEEHDNKEIEE